MTTSQTSPASEDHHHLLLRLAETFNSSLELDVVLNLVMDEVISAVQAERGFVMLKEASNEQDGGELEFRVARGIDRQTIDDPQFQVSRGVVEKVARGGEPLLTSDAQLDSRFSGRESIMILGLRSILCAPLKVKDNVTGVIYVDNHLQAGIFTDADLELLCGIASSAAIAIENARLYQVAVEKGRMERELQVARKVQSSLIPQEIPQLSGWDIAARWVPARQVSGDFYDFYPMGDSALGFVIADVVDKGMPAALFMAYSRNILRASMIGAASAKAGITNANRTICADAAYGMFLTMVYAAIRADQGEVTYLNAGHNPPLLLRTGSDNIAQLTRTGMLVGVDEGATYEQRTLSLGPGDIIVFYTDGVVEAIDPLEEDFGMVRLKEVILAHKEESADKIISAIETVLDEFTGSSAPFDDITLIVARRT
jgi:sigma-B regulation protein RsbU (phosphoserine phosphatase)